MEQNPRKNLFDQAGFAKDLSEIDLSKAQIDASLTGVVVDDDSGELVASIDRLLFESPLTLALRFLEPQGFETNLENLIACIDSMKLGVFAKRSGSKTGDDGRPLAKTYLPVLYMKKPTRSSKGALLGKFYEEVAQYEATISRLQLDEAKSRKVAESAVKDESGKGALLLLQRENERLRDEVKKLQGLAAAYQRNYVQQSESGANLLLPLGARTVFVRSIKDDLVFLKGDEGQFSIALSLCHGTPSVGAKAIAYMVDGKLQRVVCIDPPVIPFTSCIGRVESFDHDQVKVHVLERREDFLVARTTNSSLRKGQLVVCLFSGDFLVGISQAKDSDTYQLDYLYDVMSRDQLKKDYGLKRRSLEVEPYVADSIFDGAKESSTRNTPKSRKGVA